MRKGLEIMLWSGVMQLVLFAAFLAGWMLHGAYMPEESAKAGTLRSLPREESQSQAMLVSLPAGTDQKSKGDLDVPAPDATEATPDEELASEPVPEDSPAVSGPEGQDAQGMNAVLRMNRGSGLLEIGNFETLTLEGGAEQCLEMGYTLLGDAGASEDELTVLAQSNAITMARICASNGSVVISCRRSQVTISPRRLKPNDSCSS